MVKLMCIMPKYMQNFWMRFSVMVSQIHQYENLEIDTSQWLRYAS